VGDLNLRVSVGRLDSVQGFLGLSFGDDDGIWLGPGFSLVFGLLVLNFCDCCILFLLHQRISALG